ncbi:MAG: hypothetical protein KGL39_38785 [Patescibacteria group bacterium]|nr:hypothetical protein [Patescibacteria group bacterium]
MTDKNWLDDVPLNEYGHVQTRDGRPAKIVARLRSDGRLLVVYDFDGEEIYSSRDKNGLAHANEDNPLDLIPIPKAVERTRYLSISPDGYMSSILADTIKEAEEGLPGWRHVPINIRIEGEKVTVTGGTGHE